MLSVRVAAALARTLPRRAGFVSISSKEFITKKGNAASDLNIYSRVLA